MEKEIELVNDIIFNAIMHGADPGGSYDCNLDGLLESVDRWMAYNHITGYLVKEVERKDSYGVAWLGVIQIVKEG